jgi:hypothetical protein
LDSSRITVSGSTTAPGRATMRSTRPSVCAAIQRIWRGTSVPGRAPGAASPLADRVHPHRGACDRRRRRFEGSEADSGEHDGHDDAAADQRLADALAALVFRAWDIHGASRRSCLQAVWELRCTRRANGLDDRKRLMKKTTDRRPPARAGSASGTASRFRDAPRGAARLVQARACDSSSERRARTAAASASTSMTSRSPGLAQASARSSASGSVSTWRTASGGQPQRMSSSRRMP